MPVIEVPGFSMLDEPRPIVPIGMYQARISGCTSDLVKKEGSKLLGSTYLKWEFTIEDPDANEWNGRKLSHITNLNDNVKTADGQVDKDSVRQAAYFLSQFLDKLGVAYDPKKGNLDTDAAFGARAMIKVGHRLYQGTPQPNIEEVFKLS